MDTRIMDQISTCFNLYNSSGIRFGILMQVLNMQTIMQVKANHKQMKPKQANHQLKAKTTPDMRKVKEHQPNMHMQVNMQHGP